MQRLMVRDLMTPDVFTLRPDDNLTALYDLMDAEHIRHIPVVDEEGDLVGLVTHRDLLRSAVGAESDFAMGILRQFLESREVRDIMNSAVEVIEPDRDIREAADLMMENKYGCLPVVDGRTLVGILTEADFVRYLARITAEEGMVIGAET